MSDNLWGVTLADMGLAVNLNYDINISVKRGFRITRGSCFIWKIIGEGGVTFWQTARLDEQGVFVEHIMFPTLEEALNREW